MMNERMEATVLVIEDHEIMMSAVSAVLEGIGVRVIQARNGREGIDAAGRELPDLVISNCNMPEADGMEVLETLRANPRTAHLPFVVISGSLVSAARERFANAGADAILEKGMDVELFVRTVCDLLNGVRKKQQAPSQARPG